MYWAGPAVAGPAFGRGHADIIEAYDANVAALCLTGYIFVNSSLLTKMVEYVIFL